MRLKLNWASLIAQLVKNPPAMQKTPVQLLGWEDPLEKEKLPTPVFLAFPCGLAGKESTCNVGDLCLIPGLGRSHGEGKGYLLQYSGLENSMDCIESDMTDDFHFPIKFIKRPCSFCFFSLAALSPPCKDTQDNFLEDEERA